MSLKFITPDLSDKRIPYAAAYLEGCGLHHITKEENADFILLGVNPQKELLKATPPVFAGNVTGKHIYDYTKSEIFAVRNAFLTAEGAVSLAVSESDASLINANILITGYGRIAKALIMYLKPYTTHISVCVRNEVQEAYAHCSGCRVISYSALNCQDYDFIFNTVPHPVFNAEELYTVNPTALLMDLASFPGGIDRHTAKHLNLRFLTANGLPARYSPRTAGEITGETVFSMIKEVFC